MVLAPGQLFLGRTVERTETHGLVPMIEGRSSIGRLGLFVHVTAGFGDVGFCGFWTLEMFAVQAGPHLCRSINLPDFLSRHQRPVHRLQERQISAQHRYPTQPAVQGIIAQRRRERPAIAVAVRDRAVAWIIIAPCCCVRRSSSRKNCSFSRAFSDFGEFLHNVLPLFSRSFLTTEKAVIRFIES